MSDITNTEFLKKQYENKDNLGTRISIHDKYSTNKQGFGNWIVSNYEIEKWSKDFRTWLWHREYVETSYGFDC